MTKLHHDFDDPLDSLFNAPGEAVPVAPKPLPAFYTKHVEPSYFEPCSKCHGSGQTPWGPCFRCRGKGGKSFKTSAADRAKARADTAARRERNEADNVSGFAAAHPAIAAWIEAKADSFEFAAAMRDAVAKYGYLTEKQLAACERCVARVEASRAAAHDRADKAPSVDVSRIEAAFDHARDSAAKAGDKIARLKLRLDAFVFSPAGANSKNPGAIYVKDRESSTYLGKIMSGRFMCSRECTSDQEARVITAAHDPEQAAIAYGQSFKECAVCGRTLTNAESRERGIGPICAEKYGW